MNVVHLITFLDNQTGGMERQALQLALRLKNKNCNVFFITCIHWGTLKRNRLKLKGFLKGIPVYRIPFVRKWRFFNAFIYFLGSISFLIVLRNRYSLIHAHQLYTSGLIACVAKIFLPPKKVIIKNCAGGRYGDVNNLNKFPCSKWLTRFINKRADVLVGVTEELIKEMRKNQLRNLKLIPNGVDTNMFVPIGEAKKKSLKRKILGEGQNKKVILFVGRLGSEKNLPVLLKAIKLVETELLLLIIGEGNQRKMLRDFVKEEGIQDKVKFMGSMDNVERFYQIADVFILPSESEGLPNVLLEAMSCGLPAIGSNIPGIREIIKHKYNGYLFKKDSARELANAIKTALSDKHTSDSFSRFARRTIENRFSLDYVVGEYIKLYKNLLH